MGILQENRFDAPQPDVQNTEYGATYVKAATESPVDEVPVEKEEEVVAAAEHPAVDDEPEVKVETANEEKPAVKIVKKTGRPKKKK